MSRGTSIWL
jgi:hypothetical protein